MSFILGILGFLIGFLVFLGGAVVGPELPDSARNGLAQFYWKLSVGAYRRPLLSINRTGDAAIYASSYDHEKEADKITTDEEEFYQDRTHATTRLKNRPFGIVYSEFNEILQPPDADIGKEYYRLVDEGRDREQFQITADGGQKTMDAWNVFVDVDRGINLVDLSNSQPRMIESFEPNDPEKAEEDIKNSQQEYKTRDKLEMISVLFAAGGGAGLAWLIWSNTSGDSAVTVPIQLGAAVLGVPL